LALNWLCFAAPRLGRFSCNSFQYKVLTSIAALGRLALFFHFRSCHALFRISTFVLRVSCQRRVYWLCFVSRTSRPRVPRASRPRLSVMPTNWLCFRLPKSGSLSIILSDTIGYVIIASRKLALFFQMRLLVPLSFRTRCGIQESWRRAPGLRRKAAHWL
jgi:hypothetical protein